MEGVKLIVGIIIAFVVFGIICIALTSAIEAIVPLLQVLLGIAIVCKVVYELTKKSQ